MPAEHPRITRERKTISAMFELYCREQHHAVAGLCASCEEMRSYALSRLARCPFQEGKTTCARCPVHCYRADMRERVRVVMRYAGPRMLRQHPWMALQHLADGLRRKPQRRAPRSK